MTDIICPLCGKPNPPDLDECQFCQAPLKTGGFLAEPEDKEGQVSPGSSEADKPSAKAPAPESASNLERAVPDWLKETEASFLEPSDTPTEEPESGTISEQIESLLNPPTRSPEPAENAIDDAWLESLLEEAGAVDKRQAHPPGKEPHADEVEGPETTPATPVTGLEFTAEGEEQPAIPTLPSEKPEWLTNLEATSKIKLEGGIFSGEPEQEPDYSSVPPEPQEEKDSQPTEQPEWLIKASSEPAEEIPQEAEAPQPTEPPEWLNKASSEPAEEIPQEAEAPQPTESPEWLNKASSTPAEEVLKEAETPIAPAELPGWLEALRPVESVSPSGPVEDISGADVVTAGPLMGLRGVISPQPSAIRPRKPPTYSIKLKVTEEQQARLRMMEELLADEEKPKPLPSKAIITSRYIFRLIVAIALLLPMIWMVVSNSQQSSTPQPGNVPGVVDFTQRIQALQVNATVLVAFDYQAGFSGEMNIAITNMLSQLMKKNAYITMVATSPAGPALAESIIKTTSTSSAANAGMYTNYANLGYIPGGTLGLLGLATSPRSILPYALNASNVWAGAALKPITTVKDFAAVIVITDDPDTARMWIEQVGPQLRQAGTPLLFISSAQAEPLIRPYYQATPAQVQGLVAGLVGGLAYARAIGNYQPNGMWDALSAGITVSILIILVGSITGVVMKMIPVGKKKEP
jgi:hypothetical protein